MSLIKLKRVSKYYYGKNTISCGFEKVNLELNSGEFVVFTGESGSGKSTLLNVISGLDSYEDGEMYINDKETSHYTETDYEQYRRKYIGNIFQNFNLVNSYTVFQNVELVLLLNGYKKSEVKQKVLDVIEKVGLTKYKNSKASRLSGGQKQRVAIARALVKETPIIVADEPTGNLDVESAKSVMKLLSELSKERLVIVVTHNYEQVEEYATRKITMNDGKIIEDKQLKQTVEEKTTPIEYKNIRFMNKLNLGLRNTFNIKVKFALLVLLYLFLTAWVFSSYSSIRKKDFEDSNEGRNMYFSSASSDRIVINKKDKSQFTEEDFNSINKLSNIKSITKDDMFTDLRLFLFSEMMSYVGNIESSTKLDRVDLGRLPSAENEVVIKCNKDYYYIELNEDELYIMQDDNGSIIRKDLKVVGIVFDKNCKYDESYFYVNDNLIQLARKANNVKYSNIELSLNDKIYKNDSSTLPYTIVPNADVEPGNAIVSEEFAPFCNNKDCKNENFHIYVSNSYHESSVDVTPNEVFNKNTVNKYLGIPKEEYDIYRYYIYISNEDYDELFVTAPYQSSVYVEDIKTIYDTAKELKELGYNTYVMKDMIYSEYGEFAGVMKILRVVGFAFTIIALFFISYFIIRIILKSRNTYYSIIRILGSTKKVSKQLLMIELLNDINIAYLTFIGAVALVKNDIINNNYIREMVTYFNIKDYIIVYCILLVMSILISTKYAKELFKASALKTYRDDQ